MSFKTYHPVVNFVYFAFVIGFACVFMHPVCLCLSFFCAFLYSVLLKGKRAVKTNLVYTLPVMLTAAVMNPAFNHRGVTVLTYFPGGNPLTLESVLYGIAAAVMIVTVILWFSCFNEVMTSDKIMYLFGKILPSLSLVFSMTLRFIPRFTAQLRVVSNAQKCIGRDMTGGSIIKRAKAGLSVLSVMITWALENSIDTADSMKSRGYGIPGRTAFSVFRFDKRDRNVLFCILLLGIYVFAGALAGGVKFTYFPAVSGGITFWSISIFAAYLLLCVLPVIIELAEVRKWKAIK